MEWLWYVILLPINIQGITTFLARFFHLSGRYLSCCLQTVAVLKSQCHVFWVLLPGCCSSISGDRLIDGSCFVNFNKYSNSKTPYLLLSIPHFGQFLGHVGHSSGFHKPTIHCTGTFMCYWRPLTGLCLSSNHTTFSARCHTFSYSLFLINF